MSEIGTAVVGKGFMLDTADELGASITPMQLVTLDGAPYLPEGQQIVDASAVSTPRGAAVVFFGNGSVMSLPLPESLGLQVYQNEAKQRYTWRSKKFVFTGNVEMGAAKVVYECGGNGVRFRLYVDCCCVYETVVRGCVPFTLPDQLRGIIWEIELQGCSRVTEVHLAPTIRELSDRE